MARYYVHQGFNGWWVIDRKTDELVEFFGGETTGEAFARETAARLNASAQTR